MQFIDYSERLSHSGKMLNKIELRKIKKLRGEIIPPPDKSISHRAVMFASLAQGKSIVRNFLMAEDPISTMKAMRMLGVEIGQQTSRAAKNQPKATAALLRCCASDLVIYGNGLNGLKEPFDVINCGNSGTTIRLLSGILAGNPFFSALTGDNSLKQRPMARVIKPLKEMGAHILGRDGDRYLPISIRGGSLKAIHYDMPVASAQVKSCLILAGMYADGTTVITEPYKSRDHTERMLKSMGAELVIDALTIRVKGSPISKGGIEGGLTPLDITVPADFSSAAFFIAGALMVPGSEIYAKNVGVNPTRTGLLNVLRDMGAFFKIENMRDVSGEPVADILCKTSENLKAVKIDKDLMPSLIDEFPILCILATQAEGITEIRGAEELRVKESDRIKAMALGLSRMGVEFEEFSDGLSIKGKTPLKGAVIDSHEDHRIAMAFAIASLLAKGKTTIKGISSVNISFPGFFETLRKLGK